MGRELRVILDVIFAKILVDNLTTMASRPRGSLSSFGTGYPSQERVQGLSFRSSDPAIERVETPQKICKSAVPPSTCGQ